jgi:hypothetical protein
MKAIILFLLVSPSILAQTENLYQTGPGGRPISIVDKISYNLELLERDYLTKLSYRDYIRAKDLLIETYNLLLAIPLPPPPIPVEAGPYPISEEEFSGLVNSIKNEPFQENQLSVVQISARYNYYTVNQVVKVIDLFSFSDGKLSALEYLYPNVVDKFNSHQIVNAFTYSSDKEKATVIINRY